MTGHELAQLLTVWIYLIHGEPMLFSGGCQDTYPHICDANANCKFWKENMYEGSGGNAFGMGSRRVNFLVIDDERTFVADNRLGEIVDCPHNVDDSMITYARTSRDGLAELAKHWVNAEMKYGSSIYLFLDHDLGEGDDIMVVVDFLCCAQVPLIHSIYVHSQNPAADKIVPVLGNAGYFVKRIPLPNLV